MTVATEGIVDTAVAKRILSSLRLDAGPVYGERGKPWLDRRIRSYNQAARYAPWFILRDLDHDGDCAPSVATDLLAAPASTCGYGSPCVR